MDCYNECFEVRVFFRCLRGEPTRLIVGACMQAFEGGGVHMLIFFIFFCFFIYFATTGSERESVIAGEQRVVLRPPPT